MMKLELPQLPFEINALEPYISEKTAMGKSRQADN